MHWGRGIRDHWCHTNAIFGVHYSAPKIRYKKAGAIFLQAYHSEKNQTYRPRGELVGCGFTPEDLSTGGGKWGSALRLGEIWRSLPTSSRSYAARLETRLSLAAAYHRIQWVLGISKKTTTSRAHYQFELVQFFRHIC